MYDYRDFVFRTIDADSGLWTNPDRSLFNPGMTLHNKELYFAYRTGNVFWLPTGIVVGNLDNQLNPKNTFSAIAFPGMDYEHLSLEDPRFFTFKDELYLQMSLVNRDETKANWTRVAITRYPNLVLQVLNYTRKQDKPWEKCWTFYEYDGELYCTYTLENGFHAVCQIKGSNADLKYVTEYQCPAIYNGCVRSSSNMVLKDGLLWGMAQTGDYEVKDKERVEAYYDALFYAIEPTPPFRVKYIQKAPMLTSIDSNFIRPRNMTVRSVLGSGLMLEKNENWIVAAGINDITTAFMRIPHSVVMKTVESCAI